MFKTKRVKREKRLLYSVTKPKKPLTRKVGSVEKYWGVFFSFIVFCIFAL